MPHRLEHLYIENKKLQNSIDTLEKNLKEKSIVVEFTQVISREFDVQEILKHFKQIVKRILDYSYDLTLFYSESGKETIKTNKDLGYSYIKEDDYFYKSQILKKRDVIVCFDNEALRREYVDPLVLEETDCLISCKVSTFGVSYIIIFLGLKDLMLKSETKKLVKHLVSIASLRLEVINSDARLKDSFDKLNKTLIQKEKLKNILIKSAYQDGFAENATSVLHNIGNLITPLMVGLQNQMHIKKLFDTIKVIDLIAANESKDVREKMAKDLKDFIIENGNNIIQSHRDGESLLNRISQTIDLQQKYTTLKKSYKSVIDVSALIEDVYLAVSDSVDKSAIKFQLEKNEDYKVMCEHNGLYHVLLNLLTNSIESINERKKKEEFDGEIILKVHQGESNYLSIEVIDNGVGISVEQSNQIFSFGFTSKVNGSGFGLHSSNNFIESIGGKISFSCELGEKGRVTIFKVSLPI